MAKREVTNVEDVSLLRTRSQTARWYAKKYGAYVALILVAFALVNLTGSKSPHGTTSPTTVPTTVPPVTTTTVAPPTTTVPTTVPHPVTTTTVTPPTTVPTTIHVAPSFTSRFSCTGGQSVVVTGTGSTRENSLTVTGPGGYQKRVGGETATISFRAVHGSYTAVDTDTSGGASLNWASSPGCSG